MFMKKKSKKLLFLYKFTEYSLEIDL